MSIRKKANKPKIVVVCGPTASGKTGLAIKLCKKFNGEIVNADSRQVYREMDIGTAKGLDKISNFQFSIFNDGVRQRRTTIQGVPIHLVDVVGPDERYNVGRFKEDAEAVIEDIILRGKVPFVVGGTGMYIDALIENYKLQITNYKQNSNVKNQMSKIFNIKYSILDFKNKSLQELIEALEKLDPEALNIVDLKNRRRVERALEYCLTTGEKFSQSRKKGERRYDVLKLAPAVSLDREKLYERINKRVPEMIDEGLEEEVRTLAEKYGWGSEAMTGIGYKEWRPLFENYKLQIIPRQARDAFGTNYKTNPKSKIQKGDIIENVIEEIKKNTRNYAKRQITWYKRDKEIQYVDLKKAEKLVKDFLK